MKPDPRKEADRWLRQAEHDLAAGAVLQEEGFWSDACFYAQQSTEKALKALRYYRGALPRQVHQTSGTSGLLQAVIVHDPSFRQYQEDAGILDQYYIPTRYPNALPDRAPYEVYSERQAEEAIERARRIVGDVRRVIETGE